MDVTHQERAIDAERKLEVEKRKKTGLLEPSDINYITTQDSGRNDSGLGRIDDFFRGSPCRMLTYIEPYRLLLTRVF